MKKNVAKSIATKFNSQMSSELSEFKIQNAFEEFGNPLTNFHQWADGKPVMGGYQISSKLGQTMYILLIDWYEDDNFYVVLFPEGRNGPLAELHVVKRIHDIQHLVWKYNPTKRDSRNSDRKSYFESHFGSLDVTIAIPNLTSEVDDFLAELFSLSENRVKADHLDTEEPVRRFSFPEGKAIERLHKQRERNPKLITIAKERALKLNGKLVCEVCDFDFSLIYGDAGKGFIEAHHNVPVSELQEGDETCVEEISLVCSNCHAIIHWHRPWLTVRELREIVFLQRRI